MPIHAFTEFNAPSYPAYVSLNERQGEVELTVRSRGNGGRDCGSIVLDRERLRSLANDIYSYLEQH